MNLDQIDRTTSPIELIRLAHTMGLSSWLDRDAMDLAELSTSSFSNRYESFVREIEEYPSINQVLLRAQTHVGAKTQRRFLDELLYVAQKGLKKALWQQTGDELRPPEVFEKIRPWAQQLGIAALLDRELWHLWEWSEFAQRAGIFDAYLYVNLQQARPKLIECFDPNFDIGLKDPQRKVLIDALRQVLMEYAFRAENALQREKDALEWNWQEPPHVAKFARKLQATLENARNQREMILLDEFDKQEVLLREEKTLSLLCRAWGRRGGYDERTEVIFPLSSKSDDILETHVCFDVDPKAQIAWACLVALEHLRAVKNLQHWEQTLQNALMPTWERVLAAFDVIYSDVKLVSQDAPLQLCWLLKQRGDFTICVAGVRSQTKAGRWSKPKVLQPQLAQLRPDVFSKERDRVIYEYLSFAEHLHGRDVEVLSLRVLKLIAGDSRIVDDSGEPLRVVLTRLEYRARQTDTATVLEPLWCGQEVNLGFVQRQLFLSALPDTFVNYDAQTRTVTVTEVSRKDLDTLELLQRTALILPVEQTQALLQHLPAWGENFPLRLDQSLVNEEVLLSPQWVLRLRVENMQLFVELGVRPNIQAPFQRPGEGPAELIYATEDRKIARVRREIAEEVQQAQVLSQSLALGESAEALPWTWRLGIDVGLELVERLPEFAELKVEWLESAVRVVKMPAKSRLKLSVHDRYDWFGVEADVAAGKDRVSLALLLEAVRADKRYVQLDGDRWLRISEQLAAELRSLSPTLFQGTHGVELSPAAIPVLQALDIEVDAQSKNWLERWQRFQASRNFEPKHPAQLQAELRQYQIEGYQWLSRLYTWRMGACLADDMGLGKTVQTLALLLDASEHGPCLVVAPTSLEHNWIREMQRFAPSLRPIQYRESDRLESLKKLQPGDVLVVSYGLMQRDVAELATQKFEVIVFDEAQAMKNFATLRNQAARKLDGAWRVALTGTPMENDLSELWAIFRVVSPGLLGSWRQFSSRFVERDAESKGAPDTSRQELQRLLQPYILRRTKAAVLPELPAKTEITLEVDLSAAERELYEDARLAAVADLAQIDLKDAATSRIHVLAALTRLRQLACHPRLVETQSPIVSTKLETLLGLLEPLVAEGQSVLVFSQFTRYLALVREALDEAKLPWLYLDGQTTPKERAERVEHFQARQKPIFLISLKAGGTGLNLTAAGTVIHLDPWWNPAVLDQATDRAHRIGQAQAVNVYRIIARNTIEERILALHADKRNLVGDVLDGTDRAAKLSTAELVALIQTERIAENAA